MYETPNSRSALAPSALNGVRALLTKSVDKPQAGGRLVKFATTVRIYALNFTKKLGIEIKGRGTPEISLFQ